jgi:hypothetical protein
MAHNMGQWGVCHDRCLEEAAICWPGAEARFPTAVC